MLASSAVCCSPLCTPAPPQAGDELVFFYNSTEWELSAPFACRCNTSACCGTVRGAKHMTPAQLSHYRLTDFIKGKLSSQQSA